VEKAVRMRIGLISDTHGLLRQEVMTNLQTCELILHAGDINQPKIIDQLKKIAPLIVVRGNNDKGQWADKLPLFEVFTVCGLRFYLVHQKKDLPKALSDIDVAIIGHSHRYSDTMQDHTRILNPGSCGKRRFDLPITMALLNISNGHLEVEPILLDSSKE